MDWIGAFGKFGLANAESAKGQVDGRGGRQARGV